MTYYSGGKKLIVFIFLTLISFVPILSGINIFSLQNNIQILNFYSLVACFFSIVLFQFKLRLSKNFIIILFLLLISLTVNYIFGIQANFKWYLNWLGFLFIFSVSYLVFFNFTNKDLDYFNKLLKTYFFLFILFFGLLFLILLIFNFESILINTKTGFYNNTIAIFADQYNLHKQKSGFTFLLFILFIFFFRKEFKSQSKILLLLSILLTLPILLGIRSLILGSGVFLFIYFILRYKLNNRILILLFLLLAFVFFMLLSDYSSLFNSLYEYSSPRSNLYSASFDIININIFGVGNGGFYDYVNENKLTLIYNFGSQDMKLNNWFPNSPESDIVFFISSWGILSILFFLIMIYIIYNSYNLLIKYKYSIYPLEKLIITATAILFFMGISEDYNNLVYWWIFSGSSFGVIDRYKRYYFEKNKVEN